MFSKLSILIPCYNEAAFIADAIRKVIDAKLKYPLEKEIIVIDDGSTDNTFETVQALSNSIFLLLLFVMIRTQEKGSASWLRWERSPAILLLSRMRILNMILWITIRCFNR
jgi:glycosyltransferase involved in cell wall biosynthesis